MFRSSHEISEVDTPNETATNSVKQSNRSIKGRGGGLQSKIVHAKRIKLCLYILQKNTSSMQKSNASIDVQVNPPIQHCKNQVIDTSNLPKVFSFLFCFGKLLNIWDKLKIKWRLNKHGTQQDFCVKKSINWHWNAAIIWNLCCVPLKYQADRRVQLKNKASPSWNLLDKICKHNYFPNLTNHTK